MSENSDLEKFVSKSCALSKSDGKCKKIDTLEFDF